MLPGTNNDLVEAGELSPLNGMEEMVPSLFHNGHVPCQPIPTMVPFLNFWAPALVPDFITLRR